MAYPAEGGPGSVAVLNARIGGLRKRIRDRKLAISERCIAKFRTGLVPGGMLLDSETALWCREVIDLEAEIQSLLAEVRRARAAEDEAAGVFYSEPGPPSPALRFSERITPQPPAAPAPCPVVTRAAEQAPEEPQPPEEPRALEEPPERRPAKPVVKRVRRLPAFTPGPESHGGVVVCKICGLENKKDTRFCQECGSPLASAAPPVKLHAQPRPPARIYCPECGEPNEPGGRFCGDCGARLS